MLYRVMLKGHNFDEYMSLQQARKYQKGDGNINYALPYHHQTIIFQYNSKAYNSVSMPIIFKTNPVIACVASVSSRGSSRKLGQEQ